MNFKFYKEQELEKLFAVNDIHIIKDLIIGDFYFELKKADIVNPDIGIDKDGLIILAHPKNRRNFIETKLHYSEYKEL